MMLIILDKNPIIAVKKLVKLTDKRFYHKQLIELCQLICSAGFSKVYKKIYRGKEIQQWIKENINFTFKYLDELFYQCHTHLNMSETSTNRIIQIMSDLQFYVLKTQKFEAKDAVFRYHKSYNLSKFNSNEKLDIFTACKEYQKYIKWKTDKRIIKI